MKQGHFCFLEDQYYKDFPDDKLMKNKETINGVSHNRPCFFAFPDTDKPEISWLVPVSSKYEKFKAIYDKKVQKYGRCNTIRFGELIGTKAAFLIQNICPVTKKYIHEVYVDKNGTPIQVDSRTVADVIKNAQEVLALVKRGSLGVVFPDIKAIYAGLTKQLEREQTPEKKGMKERLSAAQNEASARAEQKGIHKLDLAQSKEKNR